jgi:hypothetical protein
LAALEGCELMKKLTFIELLMLGLVGLLAFIAEPSRPRTPASHQFHLALKKYEKAQSVYRETFGVYGSMSQLAASARLDPVIANSSSPTNTSFWGHWFDDTFEGLDLRHQFQCIVAPININAGSTIFLINEEGKIYLKEVSTAPDHGVTARITPAELQNSASWELSRLLLYKVSHWYDSWFLLLAIASAVIVGVFLMLKLLQRKRPNPIDQNGAVAAR